MNPVIDKQGYKRWYNNEGQLHREDGPSVECPNGTKYWHQNGRQHRVEGPAIEHADGRKEWYQNNQLHRINGPAIEIPNGHKEWWVDGKHHRIDGPAIEFANGNKSYYIKGKKFTEEKFLETIMLEKIKISVDGAGEKVTILYKNANCMFLHISTKEKRPAIDRYEIEEIDGNEQFSVVLEDETKITIANLPWKKFHHVCSPSRYTIKLFLLNDDAITIHPVKTTVV